LRRDRRIIKYYSKETFMRSLNNIAIMNPNKEDCAKINARILNTLIRDNSRTYCGVNSKDNDDKSD